MFNFLRRKQKKDDDDDDDDDNTIVLIKTDIKNDTIVLEKINKITRDAQFVNPSLNSPYDIIAFANWNDTQRQEYEKYIQSMPGVTVTESRLLVKIEDND